MTDSAPARANFRRRGRVGCGAPKALRRMVRETRLSVDSLIYPVFVVPGADVQGRDRLDARRLSSIG